MWGVFWNFSRDATYAPNYKNTDHSYALSNTHKAQVHFGTQETGNSSSFIDFSVSHLIQKALYSYSLHET